MSGILADIFLRLTILSSICYTRYIGVGSAGIPTSPAIGGTAYADTLLRLTFYQSVLQSDCARYQRIPSSYNRIPTMICLISRD